MDRDVSKIQEIFYELCVEEVMTPDVITVTPQTSIPYFPHKAVIVRALCSILFRSSPFP